jgi:hypothetical protein
MEPSSLHNAEGILISIMIYIAFDSDSDNSEMRWHSSLLQSMPSSVHRSEATQTDSNATHYISSYRDLIVTNLYAAEVNLISHILVAVIRVDVRGQSNYRLHLILLLSVNVSLYYLIIYLC